MSKQYLVRAHLWHKPVSQPRYSTSKSNLLSPTDNVVPRKATVDALYKRLNCYRFVLVRYLRSLLQTSSDPTQGPRDASHWQVNSCAAVSGTYLRRGA
jgi:hypothetical protein